MSVKIKISYERPEELHIVLKQLQPMIRHVKSLESRKGSLSGPMLIWGMWMGIAVQTDICYNFNRTDKILESTPSGLA